LDSRRKDSAVAETVLRKDGIGEADIATFKREWVQVYDSGTGPVRVIFMLGKAGVIM
jgi:hypothetical protein